MRKAYRTFAFPIKYQGTTASQLSRLQSCPLFKPALLLEPALKFFSLNRCSLRGYDRGKERCVDVSPIQILDPSRFLEARRRRWIA
jgi:hypothetical protein